MLSLNRNKSSYNENRGEMGRSLVTTGRMATYSIRWGLSAVSDVQKKKKRRGKKHGSVRRGGGTTQQRFLPPSPSSPHSVDQHSLHGRGGTMMVPPPQCYNGEFLPDILLSTFLCSYHRGTRLNAMNSFCPYSLLCSPLNVLKFPPLIGWMLRSVRCVSSYFSFKQLISSPIVT